MGVQTDVCMDVWTDVHTDIRADVCAHRRAGGRPDGRPDRRPYRRQVVRAWEVERLKDAELDTEEAERPEDAELHAEEAERLEDTELGVEEGGRLEDADWTRRRRSAWRTRSWTRRKRSGAAVSHMTAGVARERRALRGIGGIQREEETSALFGCSPRASQAVIRRTAATRRRRFSWRRCLPYDSGRSTRALRLCEASGEFKESKKPRRCSRERLVLRRLPLQGQRQFWRR